MGRRSPDREFISACAVCRRSRPSVLSNPRRSTLLRLRPGGPTVWAMGSTTVVRLVPEQAKVGLAVLSERHTCSNAPGGALGQTRPTAPECSPSRHPGSKRRKERRDSFLVHAKTRRRQGKEIRGPILLRPCVSAFRLPGLDASCRRNHSRTSTTGRLCAC